MVPYGVFLELERGVGGLIHVTEISWQRRGAKPKDIFEHNKIYEVVVLDIQEKEQRISLGYRQLQDNPWERIARDYPLGARVRGVVQRITPYGVFLELEKGIDGMIHISDMSWTQKVEKPEDIVKQGEVCDAVVLLLDVENQKIALGIKQLTENPWQVIQKKIKVGSIVDTVVFKVLSKGINVKLQDGIIGWIYSNQVAQKTPKDLNALLKEGDPIKARVLKIDPKEHYIELSVKAVDEEYHSSITTSMLRQSPEELASLGDILSQAQSDEGKKRD